MQTSSELACAALIAVALSASACRETYDLGSTRAHGSLPVDERNPILLVDDGAYDNWAGEYAILLAASGGPKLAGIVVDASSPWPDIQTNVVGWRGLVAAARASGIRDIPDPMSSVGPPLVMPSNGDIDATPPNRSEGAMFIVDASRRLSLPYRPLVVVTGGPLTDVADAYLVDPTVAERVVVVSSLGGLTSGGGDMGAPNGNLDPWADTIVAARFRYVQVSAFYDQTGDVPDSRVAELPSNALGTWIAAKRPSIYQWSGASDQVAIISVGVPAFVTDVARMAAIDAVDGGAATGPALTPDPTGSTWLVTGTDGGAAAMRFWTALNNPATYEQ